MPKKIQDFKIYYHRFLDETGKLENPLPNHMSNNTELLLKMHRMMLQTRLFDAKAIALQRTGKLGTYPSTLGQEAIGVGIGAAMHQNDVFCGYYRECGAQFLRGVKMSELFAYWGGDERGSAFTECKEDFPICVPIASQTLHAAGVATAFKIRREKRAVVTALGDGATSRGDFYEAMNVAGVWELPLVFVINNNQWAISVPRREQTKAETLAQKAIAAGISGQQVDGNDVISIYDAVYCALQKAYSGKGPSLIEAITYRMCDHTTADDAKRYRSTDELKYHEKEDPLLRLTAYLNAIGVLNSDKEKKLKSELLEEVNQAVLDYQSMPKRTPDSMFSHLYQVLPSAFLEQLEEIQNIN